MIPIARYVGLIMKLALSSGRLIFNVNRVMTGNRWPLSLSTSSRPYATVIMESTVRTIGFEVISEMVGTNKAER